MVYFYDGFMFPNNFANIQFFFEKVLLFQNIFVSCGTNSIFFRIFAQKFKNKKLLKLWHST